MAFVPLTAFLPCCYLVSLCFAPQNVMQASVRIQSMIEMHRLIILCVTFLFNVKSVLHCMLSCIICGLQDSLTYWLLIPQYCIKEQREGRKEEPETEIILSVCLEFLDPDEL